MTTTIFVLFTSGRPYAIGGRIFSIIVSTFKHMFGCWSASHVCDEITIVRPSFAYRDAATAVIFICLIVWIVASIAHVSPNRPFRCSFCFAMLQQSFAMKFNSETSARESVATGQMFSLNDFFISTVTVTQPIPVTFSIAVELDCDQPSESMSRDIYRWHQRCLADGHSFV